MFGVAISTINGISDILDSIDSLGGGHFLSRVGGRSEFQINAQFFHTPPK